MPRIRGAPLLVPGLTQPARAFGPEYIDAEDFASNEYSGNYTTRGGKVRKLQAWNAWLSDSKLGVYESPVIVCGIRPNEHAKDPNVYETVADCICLTNAEQLGKDKHDLLGDGYFPIKYVTEDINPSVYFLINWTISVPTNCLRDPFHADFLTVDGARLEAGNYVRGFLGASGRGSARSIKRVDYLTEPGLDELLGFLEAWDKKIAGIVPKTKLYIQPALTFHRSAYGSLRAVDQGPVESRQKYVPQYLNRDPQIRAIR